MTMMTSACANKMLRKLNEDKEYYRSKEVDGMTYVAALDEEPVIPEYDYGTVAAAIAEIDEKILIIKHAINLNNTINRIQVGDKDMSIDEILVKMAQLNRRKGVLDIMRKKEPKTRINSGYYASRKAVPEYEYINYDLDEVKAQYEKADAEIAMMQMALDKYNQTFEFEVAV